MARITRKLQKIFALNSSDNGQFGSARAGTKVQTTDVEVLQALPAYGDGWNAATISGAKLPTLEEMQGLQYGLSYQIAYLMQEGIAEYQAATAYYIDSIVKEPGSVKLYASLTNNNVGNALSNATHWRLLVDLETVQPLNNFTATVNPTVNDDAGDGYSAGSTWYNTVGADLFMCVNATVGAAVWVDTGVDLSDLGALAFLNTVGSAQIDNGAVTAIKVGSDVATTAGTQALTNKTVNLASNTLTGTLAEFNAAISDGDIPTITPWVAYTPTFTGFGTPTNVNFYSRRNGNDLEIRGAFTAGTSTATEARITYGFNGTNSPAGLVADSAVITTSPRLVGMGVFTQTAAVILSVLAESGLGYMTFGFQSGTGGGLTKQNGNAIIGSPNGLAFQASIPMTGW